MLQREQKCVAYLYMGHKKGGHVTLAIWGQKKSLSLVLLSKSDTSLQRGVGKAGNKTGTTFSGDCQEKISNTPGIPDHIFPKALRGCYHKYTQFPTPPSGTILYVLSNGVVYFVLSVSSQNLENEGFWLAVEEIKRMKKCFFRASVRNTMDHTIPKWQTCARRLYVFLSAVTCPFGKMCYVISSTLFITAIDKWHTNNNVAVLIFKIVVISKIRVNWNCMICVNSKHF